MPKPIKHILVIRFSALGDVAMTVPVIRAFVQQYPGVRLTILTKSFLKPLFEDIDNVEVLSADLKGRHKGLKGLCKLSKELKKLNIDAVADLHNVLRTKVLRALLPKPFVQIDKGRKEKKAIVKGIIFEQLKATHQRYADVFETLGFKIDLSNPEFPDKAELDEDLSTYFDVKTKV